MELAIGIQVRCRLDQSGIDLFSVFLGLATVSLNLVANGHHLCHLDPVYPNAANDLDLLGVVAIYFHLDLSGKTYRHQIYLVSK